MAGAITAIKGEASRVCNRNFAEVLKSLPVISTARPNSPAPTTLMRSTQKANLAVFPELPAPKGTKLNIIA